MKPTLRSRLRSLCFAPLALAAVFAPGCAAQSHHHLASAAPANRGDVVGTQGSTAAVRREVLGDESFSSGGSRNERGIPTPQPAREPRVSLPTPQPPLPDRPTPSFSGRSPGAVGRYASW